MSTVEEDIADAGLREFAYTGRDFERVRSLIRQRAGISLAASKQHMVYSRLARRLRALRLGSFRDYLDRLESHGDEQEWQAFTNALTTNLTAFFREPHHFGILDRLLKAQPKGQRLLLWSAGSSTGEEPYSMAMAAIEALGPSPPVAILATDIDTSVLDVGQRGVYPVERIERLSPARRKRFFRRGVGANSGFCRVADEVRQLVQFRRLNLLDARWPLRGPYAAIFCRNVMIYFDKPTQHRILEKMVPRLASDGLFFAGHSESFFHAEDLIRSCGRTVYCRAKPG